jgi:hypothetical protein
LLGGGGGGGGGRRSAAPALQPAAAKKYTGRSVAVSLPATADAQLASATRALEKRAAREAEDGDDVFGRLAALVERAKRDLDRLHGLAVDGAVRFEEYVDDSGRLGYACGSYLGIKSILRELRPVVFTGMWSADLRRCHTSVLVGAHGRAVRLGVAKDDDAQLRALRDDMPGVEARLRSEQQLLASRPRPDGAIIAKYLHMKPSQLLSAFINHPDRSPVFSTWPLAAACCRAIGTASVAAAGHFLVEADPLRPEAAGLRRRSRHAKQRVALLLERRAVCALLAALERIGHAPSVTINDEVLFEGNVYDPPALERQLERAVEDALDFRVGVKLSPL